MIKMWKAKERKDSVIYFPCLWDKPWTSSIGKFPLSAHPPPCVLRPAAALRRENALAQLILSTPAKAHTAPAHCHDVQGHPGTGELEQPPTDPRWWRDHWDAREWVDPGERKGTHEREKTIQSDETGARESIKQLTVLAGLGRKPRKRYLLFFSYSHSPSETFLVYLKRLVWDGRTKNSVAFSNATFQQAGPLPVHRCKPSHFGWDKLCQTQQQDTHQSIQTRSQRALPWYVQALEQHPCSKAEAAFSSLVENPLLSACCLHQAEDGNITSTEAM